MGIFDIASKLLKRITGLISKDNELEEDLEAGIEEKSADEEFEEARSTSKFEKETAEEEPEPEYTQRVEVNFEDVRNELKNIKSKLDLIETHIENLELKDTVHRGEADRYIQYLSYINEKIDHLEAEHSEIERLMQKRKD